MKFLIPIVLLAGCTGLPEIPVSMSSDARSCVAQVATVEVAEAQNNQHTFTDSRDALVASVVDALVAQNAANPFESCFAEIKAFYAMYGIIVQANSAIVQKAIGATTIPASLVAGGWAQGEILQSAGGIVVDATNSDVSFDSGNVRTTGESTGSAGRAGASPNVNVPDNSTDNTDNSLEIDIDDTGNVTEDSNNTTTEP